MDKNMKLNPTFALLIPLVFSSPLAFADLQAGATIPSQVMKNNKTNLYQTYKRVKLKEAKAIPTSVELEHKAISFKPFIPKSIIITLDGI